MPDELALGVSGGSVPEPPAVRDPPAVADVPDPDPVARLSSPLSPGEFLARSSSLSSALASFSVESPVFSRGLV